MTAFVAVPVFKYPTLSGRLAGGQGDVYTLKTGTATAVLAERLSTLPWCPIFSRDDGFPSRVA